jgi:hypothetical protein
LLGVGHAVPDARRRRAMIPPGAVMVQPMLIGTSLAAVLGPVAVGVLLALGVALGVVLIGLWRAPSGRTPVEAVGPPERRGAWMARRPAA